MSPPDRLYGEYGQNAGHDAPRDQIFEAGAESVCTDDHGMGAEAAPSCLTYGHRLISCLDTKRRELEHAARAFGLVRAFPAWCFLKVLSANSSSRCGQRRTTNEIVADGASNDHDVPLRLETHGSAPHVR